MRIRFSLLLVMILTAAVPLSAFGEAKVLKNFVEDFQPAFATNTELACARLLETAGGVSMPGIFLHTKGAGDSLCTFRDVSIPALSEGKTCWLVFRLGMRDGIPWGEEDCRANGVRFSVVVDGQKVFEEERKGAGWHGRAVNLTPWAGRSVPVEFRTNSIDGNTNHDWALFGQPLVVQMDGGGEPARLEKGSAGIALIELSVQEKTDVKVSMGNAVETGTFDAGTQLICLAFPSADAVKLEVSKGSAKIESVLADLYAPVLEFKDPVLSTPLITVGRPFKASRVVRNTGLGTYKGGDAIYLGSPDDPALKALGAAAQKPFTMGTLAPGEEQTYIWEGLAARTAGPDGLPFGDAPSRYVFPKEPSTSPARPKGPEITVTPGKAIRATVGNPWSRLSFVVSKDGHGYAIAETWAGDRWQRAATLAPLARVVVRHSTGEREELDLKIHNIHSYSNWLMVYAMASSSNGKEGPVLIIYSPDPDEPRISMEFEALAPTNVALLAFYGPTVLAGDRAFGANKEFALFPGLEYLEGDEESSSTRDLAPPLNDRRVPAPYKIAAPLMAVQAQDALVSLQWDENQEWAAGEKHPAARFLAPAKGTGSEQIHMSLFAPSVGEYVKENEYEADIPYPLNEGQRVRLTAWLVLDHASRYDAGSIVKGPHRGGLVLQAMRHWYDLFGMPAPSNPPRDWEQEKALCRQAYYKSVWHEDPPGWSHCQGWEGGPFVGHAVPLLLDIREGVSPGFRKNSEARIERVVNRAIKESGKGALASASGCHVLKAELPFYYGYVGESMRQIQREARQMLSARKEGLWVWRPQSEKYACLGDSGGHTLGQAAHPCMRILRAARMTGDPELTARALEAMKQMERYEVPRGSQTWECPLYQPDILAAGQAIRAYCEAYRITGDPECLAHARYWAWTGLPFLYTWELEGYPTMRYNVIAVLGSTFYKHSWIGLPVVWCGLVYAYALQDLAEVDDSFPWPTVAEGILNSAMWQQYPSGPSKGCYPDSWSMTKNRPQKADINPENILVNGFRLRGSSPEIRFARLPGENGGFTALNSAADIVEAAGSVQDGAVRFSLKAIPSFVVHTMLSPVPEPASVSHAGERAADSEALIKMDTGWLYDANLRAVILKYRMKNPITACEVRW